MLNRNFSRLNLGPVEIWNHRFDTNMTMCISLHLILLFMGKMIKKLCECIVSRPNLWFLSWFPSRNASDNSYAYNFFANILPRDFLWFRNFITTHSCVACSLSSQPDSYTFRQILRLFYNDKSITTQLKSMYAFYSFLDSSSKEHKNITK